jgi:hypothetical protein
MYTESTTGLDNIHVLPALLIAVLTVIIANEECVLIYPDTVNSSIENVDSQFWKKNYILHGVRIVLQ